MRSGIVCLLFLVGFWSSTAGGSTHSGNACANTRAVTLTELERLAKNSAHSVEELQIERITDGSDIPNEYFDYAVWLAEYHALFLELVAGGKSGETAKRIIEMVGSTDLSVADNAIKIMRMLRYVDQNTDLAIPNLERIFTAFAIHEGSIKVGLEEASALPSMKGPSLKSLLEMSYYDTYLASLQGSVERAQTTLVEISEIRASRAADFRGTPGQAEIDYVEAYTYLVLGQMFGSISELESARDLLVRSLQVFGIDCDHHFAAEVGVLLAIVNDELASFSKDKLASYSYLMEAVKAIEEAQRFVDPLHAPQTWRKVYRFSSDLYERASEASRNSFVKSQLSGLSRKAFNISLMI